jgi:hypothetical protein
LTGITWLDVSEILSIIPPLSVFGKLLSMKTRRYCTWLLLAACFAFEVSVAIAATPYPGGRAVYNGLIFTETESLPNRYGYFKINVSPNAHFSGKVRVGRRSAGFRGKFDPQGAAFASVLVETGQFEYVGGWDYSLVPEKKLYWTLGLQLTNNGDQIIGQVVSYRGSGWVASLLGDRAPYDRLANPAPQAGQYTFITPGSPEDSTRPAGDGYGTLTVDASGNVLLKGILADGSPFAHSALLSGEGLFPLFAPLYGGKGVLVGWVRFTNVAGNDLVGQLNWVRLGQRAARFYPAGFTNETSLVGSRYDPSLGILGFADSTLILSGGNLGAALTNRVSLGPNRKPLEPNSPFLSLTLPSGLFRGTVKEPLSGRLLGFGGAVLQGPRTGSGYFLGSDQAGKVTLDPLD